MSRDYDRIGLILSVIAMACSLISLTCFALVWCWR